MAVNFTLYSDAGLISPITGNLVFTVADDGSTGWVVTQLWLGSNIADRKIQRATLPGVNNIIVSLSDTTGGSGPEVTDMGLSLDDITYEANGDPLDLGVTEVLSGVPNAVTFYARAKVFAGATPGNYVELAIDILDLQEISSL